MILFSDHLVGQTIPRSKQRKHSKGLISGLAITSGLSTMKFVFTMARQDCTIGTTMEVLRLLKTRTISVKDAATYLQTAIQSRVIFKITTEINLGFSNFLVYEINLS
jgi:hypothetical protein